MAEKEIFQKNGWKIHERDAGNKTQFYVYEPSGKLWDGPFQMKRAAMMELEEQVEGKTQNSFSNGRQKAQQEIANKWPVLNAGKMFDDSRHPSKLVEAYLVKKGHSPELARKQASNMSSDELDTVVKQNGL